MIRKRHATCTAYEIRMGKLRRKKDTTGIPRYKQEDNIKLCSRELRCGRTDWIELEESRV
jgi:hypothetical protein